MQPWPLRTTVVGSYPLPGWLEFATQHLDRFGRADLAELQEDAVICALHDQLAAGLDVVTDGEQTRLAFNLSFYRHLHGIQHESNSARHFGPQGPDQRGKHRIHGPLEAPEGLGVVEEYRRLRRLAPRGSAYLKVSVPGPYTLGGRLSPGGDYRDRLAITEALIPIVRAELRALLDEGCMEITVDEPSMSAYAHSEDLAYLVDVFNRTVAPVVGLCRLSTHLCFGNYKGRALGLRRYGVMFPAFLDLTVDEIHVEMANREFAEIELIGKIAERRDVAVGIVDVKSYHIETVEEIAERVRLCLKHAPADRLAFAPDCGLSQTARWAARQKLDNLVAGVKKVREEQGLGF